MEYLDQSKHITEMENLLKRIRDDLLLRAEIHGDEKVVQLSNTLWLDLCDKVESYEEKV